MKRNAARNQQCFGGVSRSEAHARRNPFGEIVNGDRKYEQKYFIYSLVTAVHFFPCAARKLMQVRHKFVR